jgi:exosortase/archaeosortase family protein
MKPISTEDDLMKKRIVYIAAFIAALVIMLFNPLMATPSSILDTDPSTYIVVPMIMLPLFGIFVFKQKIEPSAKWQDILIGLSLFAALLLLIFYLRYYFSFLFMSFRLDMLVFPLAIASIAITMFGLREINKFKALLIYSMFASPILLAPLFAFNQVFAEMNAYIVYWVLHALDKSIIFVPPISIIGKNYTLGIGESCAGIGALIGIVMFLIPLAYLFEGKASKKVLWVLSGFAVLLLLNIARMFGIALSWFYYGPNASASFAHSFAGMAIFYATVVIIVLIPSLFGLKIPKIEKGKKSKVKERYSRLAIFSLALPIIYALIYLAIFSNYANSASFSPAIPHSSTPLEGAEFDRFIASSVNATGFHYISYTFSNSSEVILFANSTFNASNPISMLVEPPNKEAEKALFSNVSIEAHATFMGSDGINTEIYEVYYNNSVYFVAIKKVPYVYNGGYGIMAEYAVMPESAGFLGLSCNYSHLYSTFYSLFNLGIYNSTTMSRLESAYCLNEKLFR